MGSKGRVPPTHLGRPLPGGMMHPDPFASIVHHPQAPFPFDMLPPPEILEQKIATQHVEMQRLATENQRLAATHSVLRQELAAAQQELQRLHHHIGAMKAEKEQQMRGLLDKIAKMEVDLQAGDSTRLELQKSRSEAQNLVASRQELVSKVQQLTQDLQRAHADSQQVPALMSEYEELRQEYERCRATYDYEKKLYNDQLESLQVMEKNYVSMARDVEKLRSELAIGSNQDRRNGPYGVAPGYKENDAAAHVGGQVAYEEGYGAPQGHVAPPPSSGSAPYGFSPIGSAPVHPGYDSQRGGPGPGYDVQRNAPGYDASRGPGYDAPRSGTGYDAPRGNASGYDIPRSAGPGYAGGPGYDAQRAGVSGYEAPRAGGPGYEAPKSGGPGYDAARNTGYDASRGASGAQTPSVPQNSLPYGVGTTPTRSGGGYEAPLRGANATRR